MFHSHSLVTHSLLLVLLASLECSAAQPPFERVAIATFDQPWALAVLPKVNKDKGKKILVTQKTGELMLLDVVSGKKRQVQGVPSVDYGGQGGLGDVIVAPDFATSGHIYLSYVEAGKNGTRGARVIRAKLDSLQLNNIQTIWVQRPKTRGWGHYSHRLLISPDQQYLFISSGDRQLLDPAQSMSSSLGKIIRLNLDGSVPKDNPFAKLPAPGNAIWSLGHRNVLGMQFDDQGQLWGVEMGPRDGDELNKIEPAKNYGWPLVSEGRHYDGRAIPNHATQPQFIAPTLAWTPVISPASMTFYRGKEFPAWRGKMLMSGLSSRSLVVVDLGNKQQPPKEQYRYELGTRLRNITADGDTLYLMEDGTGAHLWQLTRPERR